MSRPVARYLRVSLLAAAVLICGGARARAQSCVGDCNGDTAVTIGELIRAVNVALELIPVDVCPAVDANGDGDVGIAELIQAVNRALQGCPPTPPPSATPTVTATGTATATATDTAPATATPTATPTSSATSTPTLEATATFTPTTVFPDIAGVWRENALQLSSSTCLEIIATAFAEELAQRAPCNQQVSNVDAIVTVVDCNSRAMLGNLTPLGLVTYAVPEESGEVEGCTLSLTADVSVPAAVSPTTVTYVFSLSFGGSCPLPACTLTATGPWTRISE